MHPGYRMRLSQASRAAPDRLCRDIALSLSADLYSAEPGEEEPAWVQTERQQFQDFRDLNKDGRLDGSEVGYWVLPPSQDQPLVEANHLLHESDTDKVSLGDWGVRRVPEQSERQAETRPRKRRLRQTQRTEMQDGGLGESEAGGSSWGHL